MRLIYVPVLALLLVAPAQAGPPESPAIVRVPFAGAKPARIDPAVALSGSEFELLTIQGATGPITWDATSPDSFALPVTIVECTPKQMVIGLRVGTTVPANYAAPDGPAVAVYATNTGRATLAAWGVRDGKPVKLATFTITANGAGPVPPVVPVTPTDPLAPPVQTAFAAEPASVALPDGTTRTRSIDAVGLAAAYRATATAVAGFKTIGDFAADLKKTRTAAVSERLPGVRLVLAGEIAKILPNTINTPMSAAQKTAAAALLNRFAAVLDTLQ